MSTRGIYEQHLGRSAANYAPLTPLSLIARTAYTWPQRIAVVHGPRRYTWSETYARSRRLASALAHRGIGMGDTVAVMLANTPEMVECHFGVPMTGGVLNTLNTRLDAETLAFMLEHGEAKVLITDTEFSPAIAAALKRIARKPLVIDVVDALGPGGDLLGESDYETFIAKGDPDFAWQPPADEWQAISLNYTSGTTGNPKGVVYHHRGAYLNALSNIVDWGMPQALGLPVDAADVPLQRLVLPVDDGGQRRDQRLPAQGGGQGDLRRDPRAPRHALLRRADRAFAADQRTRRADARASRTRCRRWSRRRRRRRR